ncbi:hypothetical protein EPN44_13155 [bacterium]|nr:MAG: hypothetical protein EPN44_13155 [bacterium]
MGLDDLFGGLPVMVVGGVATRAYAPERQTKDIDVMVEHERFAEATSTLAADGWKKNIDLPFPNASLGLDIISTDQEWGREAFGAASAFDTTGLRVIPLAYLTLMKIDSARGIDQGDLTRMLGRLDNEQIEAIAAIVDRHAHDPQAAEDVRQYAALGRMEWDSHRGPADTQL